MYKNVVFRRPLGVVLLLSVFFMAGAAQAQNTCRLADPNSSGEFVAEICWFQFGDADEFLASGFNQPFTFDLPDGSSVELDMSISGGAAGNPGLFTREAPIWTGSNFSGFSGYYTLLTPNSAGLHSDGGSGHQTVLTLSDVRLFRPDGTEVDDLPFQLIAADAERLNSNPEYLDFGVVSGGSEWELLEWLGDAPAGAVTQGTPATLDPGVASACLPGYIDCQRFKGETISSDANAPVVATSRDVDSGDPFTIMGQVHSNQGQGFALGVRWGSVRLRKSLPEGRVDPSDQFVYRIDNIIGETVETGETTGTGADYPFVGTMAMPGNFLTLIEEMAPGSASTLEQYESHIVCIDEYGEGDVILDEPYDANNPPEVTTRFLGDGIDCTIINMPRTVDMEFVKTADPVSYEEVGDTIEYSFTVTNNGTVELTDVAVEDPLLGGTVACTPTTLQPTESATCGPVVYTVTQADVDNGEIVNLATATALDPDDEPVEEEDTVTVAGPEHEPALDVVKALSDAPNPIEAGSVLEFTVTLTNTGNVTLSDVEVNDPLLTPAGNTCASVAPGDTCVLVGEYTVTQGDMDAGEFTNVATGAGTPPPTDDDPEPEPIEEEDEITTPLPQTPALVLTKQADPTMVSAAGDTVEYSFTVENTGNVTLTDVSVDDPLLGGAVACAPLTLAPGESASCGPVTYTVTQADVDNGEIVNLATAAGTPPPTDANPDPDPVTDEDGATVEAEQSPAMTTVKEVTDMPDPVVAGAEIEYTITVTNTGNVTLDPVVINDDLITPDSITCDNVEPGGTCVLVGTYELEQENIDDGIIVNTATSTGTPPVGDPIEQDDKVSVPLPREPALALVKSADPDSYNEAGDVIDYSFTVENTGNVTLNDVSVDDPLLGGAVACTPETLTPGETATCGPVPYTVTQQDIDDGSIVNAATATAVDPADTPVEDDDELEVDGPAHAPALEVTKALTDAPDPIVAGSMLEYTVTATNTGNVTLDPVVVEDSLITPSDITCNDVAPGGTCVLVGTYEVTQQDINDGQIDNTGSGIGTPPSTPQNPDPDPVEDEDEVTTPIEGDAALELFKSADPASYAQAGDTVDYSFTVENTGSVTLTDVSVDDPLLGGAVTCVPTMLEPGDSALCGPVTYDVTQEDVDNGEIVNAATAAALDPDQAPVEDDDELTVPGPDPDPALGLVKEAELIDDNGNGFADPDEVIEYTLTATNSGNVTLTDVTIADPMIGTLDCTPTQPTNLLPGDMLVCTGSYTVTEDDADAGAPVVNTATATGTDPNDEPVEDEDGTSTPVTPMPALELVKEAELDDTSGNGTADAGEVIEYTLTATNIGNILLDGVEIDDPMLDNLECTPEQPATLDLDESMVCTGSYTVTQEDVDAGGTILNTATATAPDPTDPNCDDPDNPECEPIEEETEEEVPVTDPAPAVALVKSADPMSYAQAGDVINYAFTVENTGNVTLTGVSVDDPLLGGTVACTPATLAPGESANCGPVAYTVTPADVDAGEIVNAATGMGTPPATPDNPDPEPVTDTDTVTVTGPEGVPALEVVKTLSDAPDPVEAGSVLSYTITATNTGNVTLSDVVVEDALITPASTTCATLAVGAICVLEGSYTVTQTDVDNGQIVNVGAAAGNPPGNEPPVEDEDEITTPVSQTPGLALLKEAALVDNNGNNTADAGEVIEYTLTATNAGDVTLSDVTIDDPLIDTLDCAPAQPATLAPGEMLVCTGNYTVTEADIDAGEPVRNVATAASPDPVEPANPPLEDEDEVSTPVTTAGPGQGPVAVPLLDPQGLVLLVLLMLLIGGMTARMRGQVQ